MNNEWQSPWLWVTIIVNVREIRFCVGCLTSYVSSRRPPRSEPLQLSPVSPVSSHRGNKFTFLAQISSPWRNPDTLLSSWRAAPVMTLISTRLALIATSVNTHTTVITDTRPRGWGQALEPPAGAGHPGQALLHEGAAAGHRALHLRLHHGSHPVHQGTFMLLLFLKSFSDHSSGVNHHSVWLRRTDK